MKQCRNPLAFDCASDICSDFREFGVVITGFVEGGLDEQILLAVFHAVLILFSDAPPSVLAVKA